MGQKFRFYRILVRYFVHERRVFHGFTAQRLYSPFKLKVNTTDKPDRSDPVLIIPPFQFKGQYNFNISEEHFCYVTASPPCLHQHLSNSSAYIFLKCRANSLGVMPLSNADNAVRRIMLTTMSPEDSVRARLLSTCPAP